MPPQVVPRPPILFTGIRGRDGASPPFSLTEEKCQEAMNIDWYQSSLGRKRAGASAISMTGSPLTGKVSSIFSFVPQSNQTLREMWAIDDAATPNWARMTGGATWSTITPGDPCTGSAQEINAVYFNRKAYFAYISGQDRMHLYDYTTNVFRRASLPKSSTPSVSNSGTGTYAATLRYYKTRWVKLSSGATTLAGELSDAVSFTPSGSGVEATISRPTVPGEIETHWEVYGSSDGGNYFLLSQVPVATGFYNDLTAPSAYTGTLAPAANSFVQLFSAKYLLADKKRVVMAGAYNPSDSNVFTKSTRYSWTAPLGASDNGDDERVENNSTQKNYDDIEEDINGLGGPVNGAIYIFSYNGAWIGLNTNLDSSPYVTQKLVGALGSIHHKAIVLAEDETNTTCLYWLSPVGPVRHGQGGFSRCHYDIDDIWATVNLNATYPPHGVWHRDLHQIWWYVATGVSNECDTRIVFDTALGRVVEVEGLIGVRRGWSRANGPSAAARCSCLMSDTLGASMGIRLKPYLGMSATNNTVWKADTGTDDNGTAFQAYVKSKPFVPWGLQHRGAITEEATLTARVSSGVTITGILTVDRGRDAKSGTCTLDAESGGTQTQLTKKLEGARVSDAKSIEIQVGDGSAASNSWNLDAVLASVSQDGVV